VLVKAAMLIHNSNILKQATVSNGRLLYFKAIAKALDHFSLWIYHLMDSLRSAQSFSQKS